MSRVLFCSTSRFPTSMRKLREEARFWIRKLILDLELCAVVVTHDQGEALAMSDRILLLKDGMIVQESSPVDIYAGPTNRYTAEFLGMNNVITGVSRNGNGRVWSLEGEGWSLPGTAIGQPEPRQGEKAVAIVRMERVRTHNQPGPSRMEMKVDGSVYLGDRWEYRLVRGALALRAQGEEPIGTGSVWCEIKPEHVWIFAAGILFTCSAFGPAIEASGKATRAPVLKPNEAMFEAALAKGDTIGMLSNFAPSNASMQDEFKALAAGRNQRATLTTVTVPEALPALRAGDTATHNRLLAEASQQLAGCDVIMLAQFSASRAQAEVQSRVRAEVLTSPGSAVVKLKSKLAP